MILLWFSIIFSSSITFATEVHGHRGSRWTHSENTLAGFQEALSAGADFIELDLGMSKDGVLIITHDAKINPAICKSKIGPPKNQGNIVRELTVAKLKEFDCGSLVNKKFPQQKLEAGTAMPTFEEFLTWLTEHKSSHAKKIQLNVETKFSLGTITASPKEYAVELARLLKKYNVSRRTVVQSFDYRSLIEIRKIDTKIKISLLVWKQSWPEIQSFAKKLNADIISPPYKWLNPKIIQDIHNMNMKVVPWTANHESLWTSLIQWGVDGIITDRPRDLVHFLKDRKKK